MSEAYENTVLREPVGNVDPAYYGSELYPAIACFGPLPNIVENFIVYRDFTDGSYQSPNIPRETLGNIKVVYIVTEREYSLF
jgi:hypothetical protein